MRWMATTYGSLKALMIALVAGQGGSAVAQDISPDDRAWEAVTASGTAEACQHYLTEFPTGSHAEEAFRCLVEGILPASPENRLPASVDIY
ncbi:MAG: hypothetical protein R3F54_15600 [Alphaproteobacteria bacterium]